MITRRKFVQLSAAALPALAHPLQAENRIPLGAQLYTVRQLAANNLPETLRGIRAIGYQEVELTPLPHDYPADELRKIVSDSGLKAPGDHFQYDELPTKFKYAQTLGLQWMVCPFIPREMWTPAGFHRVALAFNAWGKRAKEMGMRLAFHNHDYEFRQLDGVTGYEILVKNTDPEFVFFEMDCYWVAQAGRDPVQMMKHLGRRVRLLHLKDRKPGFPPAIEMGPAAAHFAEVGSGTLDWRAILAEAQKLQIEHYFVEQDQTDGPPMESLRISYNYLRKILA